MKKLSVFCLFTGLLFAFTASAQTAKKTVKKQQPAASTQKPAAKQSNASTAKQQTVTKPTSPPPAKAEPKAFLVDGVNILNVGVGLGTFYQGLPFGLSFEHGFSDVISAGVFVDYSSYNYGSYFGSSDKLTIIYAGVRGSYHFGKIFDLKVNKLDPYAGASLGYHHVSYSFDNAGYYGNPYDNSIFFGVHAGARYLFTDHIGAFAEVGYGVAALKVGATFQF